MQNYIKAACLVTLAVGKGFRGCPTVRICPLQRTENHKTKKLTESGEVKTKLALGVKSWIEGE